MNKKISMTAFIAASLLVASCKSQGTTELTTKVEDMVSTNSLLRKSTNIHAIESFDKLTAGDYREAALVGIEKQKTAIRAITTNTAAPTFENTIVLPS